jgi:glyoxylase I family protein
MTSPRRQLLQVFSLALGSSLFQGTGLAAESNSDDKEKVSGIGGFFFRAHDPKALAHWYQEHLGIALIPTSQDQQPWTQEAGPTAFSPFNEKTKYFGEDLSKVWMLNFRVRHLDRMVKQLQASGIEVKVDPQTYPNGRFGRLYDPEGNPIELWEDSERRP